MMQHQPKMTSKTTQKIFLNGAFLGPQSDPFEALGANINEEGLFFHASPQMGLKKDPKMGPKKDTFLRRISRPLPTPFLIHFGSKKVPKMDPKSDPFMSGPTLQNHETLFRISPIQL